MVHLEIRKYSMKFYFIYSQKRKLLTDGFTLTGSSVRKFLFK